MLTIDSNNYSIHLGGYLIAWNTFSIRGWSNTFSGHHPIDTLTRILKPVRIRMGESKNDANDNGTNYLPDPFFPLKIVSVSMTVLISIS
jgi:hypothetical protein